MMHRPAYAPEYFVDRRILFTIPYTMPGAWTIGPNQSGVQAPEAVFLHNVDKPFEIWRMIVRLTALDTSDPPLVLEQQPLTLPERISLSVMDTSKNERLTKNPALVSSLRKANELTWEWDPRPYTIVRQEGFQVAADSLGFPIVCAINPEDCTTLIPAEVGFVRVEVQFQGWLLIVEPPSNTRG
jgi:hypothetical protein